MLLQFPQVSQIFIIQMDMMAEKKKQREIDPMNSFDSLQENHAHFQLWR